MTPYLDAVVRRCSKEKVFLKKKMFLRQSLFFNKVPGFRPATFFKKRLRHRCFRVNSAKFLRTSFFTEHLRWLLLHIQDLQISSWKRWRGSRFINLYIDDTILFKYIRAKFEKLFFDNENWNYCVEKLHECITSSN